MPLISSASAVRALTERAATDDLLSPEMTQLFGAVSPEASKKVSALQSKAAEGKRELNRGANREASSPNVNRGSRPSEANSATMRGPYANSLRKARRGFILTSDTWLSESKLLHLHAGPSEVQFSFPLRASSEDNQGGRARYASKRPNGSYFNIGTAGFTFQTGNILPIPITSVANQNTVRTPYGLTDFYYFMELINQDPLTKEGVKNLVHVYYTSLQFPDIVLKGYFSPDGVSWNDSADSPNGFTWSASLEIYESSPDISNPEELTSTYTGFDFTLF